MRSLPLSTHYSGSYSLHHGALGKESEISKFICLGSTLNDVKAVGGEPDTSITGIV